MSAALADQLPARGQIVIDDVERFPLDAVRDTGEHDGFRAVVHKRIRQLPGPTEAHHQGTDLESDSGRQKITTWSIDHSRPDYDEREVPLVTGGPADLFLDDLAERVGIALLRHRIQRAT